MSDKVIRVALIAHDRKKVDMVAFVKDRRAIFEKCHIVATGTTGSYIEKSGLDVDLKLSGPLGGDAQIAALVAEKKLDLVIFFRDPLGMHPHEQDVQMLMRICDVHDVPLATNPKGADYLLKGIMAK